MGVESRIEWTDATWNPWRGCDKVSPGCAHCYMFTDQRRYGRDPEEVVRCSTATFQAPLRSKKWLELAPNSLVFTCSWSDWFHKKADAWRDEAWAIIRQRPDLIFQVLTKRPERIAEHLPADWGSGYENVWLGVTIENRRFVDRADILRQTPAAVRFISAEPLLGPLVPSHFNPEGELGEWIWPDGKTDVEVGAGLDLTGIDWLIVGGESGPNARRMSPIWALNLISAGELAGTRVFVKQLGKVLARELALGERRAGGNIAEWPSEFQKREMPSLGLVTT